MTAATARKFRAVFYYMFLMAKWVDVGWSVVKFCVILWLETSFIR